MIQISVYLSIDKYNARTPIFSFQHEKTDGEFFPFQSTIDTFRAIYGSSCIVVFSDFNSDPR